jgi:flagellar basal-body rod protein FlgB
MLSSMFSSTTIPLLEQVVNFAQARHEVLAGNIANIDTPGYRTRDLSPEVFQTKLKQAIESQNQNFTSVSTGTRGGGNPFAQVRDTMKGILYHDDSNLSIEKQAAEISKNQLQHNIAMTVLTSQYRLLGAAISEKA